MLVQCREYSITKKQRPPDAFHYVHVFHADLGNQTLQSIDSATEDLASAYAQHSTGYVSAGAQTVPSAVVFTAGSQACRLPRT
jgi:hypothetical protein